MCFVLPFLSEAENGRFATQIWAWSGQISRLRETGQGQASSAFHGTFGFVLPPSHYGCKITLASWYKQLRMPHERGHLLNRIGIPRAWENL